ncbi:MAG: transglutaminase-like domain-containing protein [Pirellulaceae bacterium]
MRDRFAFRSNLLLASLAVLVLQLSLYQGSLGPWWDWLEIGLVVAIAWWLRPRETNSETATAIPASVVLLALGVFFGHLVLEGFFWAAHLPAGHTMEAQLALAMRNLMLLLAFQTAQPSLVRMSSLLSLVLVSFGFFCAIHWTLTTLMLIYALVGVWWLIGSYWDRLQGHFPAGVSREVPIVPALSAIGIAAVTAALLVGVVGTDRAARALAGFMPSSGGNQISDDRATSGVGSGDNLVSGTEDAMSFGPIESEVFLESKLPSLFDVSNDMYNDPTEKQKTAKKAISLAPSTMVHRHNRVANSKKQSQEFSTVRRKGQTQKRELKDTKSPALMYVKGRVPLHLRMTIYDHWDGIALHAAQEHSSGDLQLVTRHSKPWYLLPGLAPESLVANEEYHLLKLINIKTERVPTPPHLARFHIKQVDRLDMFDWAEDGSLRMMNEWIPQLTVMHMHSQLVDRNQLTSHSHSSTFLRTEPNREEAADEEPYPVAAELTELAQQWVCDIEPGWPQVEAVVARLRSEYQHDMNHLVSEDTEDALADFLLREGAGPDYLFATAAAVLLRELGYQTRVVSGFYVWPERYDALTMQTPVLDEDIHFWLEVNPDGKIWYPLEPTPGYELLAVEPTLWQRALSLLVTAGAKVWSVRYPLLLLSVVLAVLGYFRRTVLSWSLIPLTWWPLGHDPRRKIRWTVRLLEAQARLRGFGRPEGTTMAQWLESIARDSDDDHVSVETFLRMVHWANYAGSMNCPWNRVEIHTACQAAHKLIRRYRSVATPETAHPSHLAGHYS